MTQPVQQTPIRIAVVIPCFAADAVLADQLAALALQPKTPAFEVILADNGSNHEISAICQRFSDDLTIRIADARHAPGVNVARNAGISTLAPSIELILFCDADDRVHPGWVEAYWRAYLAGARLMGGPLYRVTRGTPNGFWQKQVSDWLSFLPWPAGANCAVGREVFDVVGPFDESFRGGGDETDFFWRAQIHGYELRLVPDAAIDYVQRAGLAATFGQSRRYAESHQTLFRQYGRYGMPAPSIWASVVEAASRALKVITSRGDRMMVRDLVAGLGLITGRILKGRGSREDTPA